MQSQGGGRNGNGRRGTAREADYRAALRLLERINAIRVDGVLLADHVVEGFKAWQWQQQSLFGDIVKLLQTEDPFARSPAIGERLRLVLFHAVAVSVSAIAWTWWFLRRPRALLYSVDNTASAFRSDFRSEPLYRLCRDEHISSGEVFHTLIGWEFVRTMVRRRRIGFYLEALNGLYHVLAALRLVARTSLKGRVVEWGSLQGKEQEIAALLLARYYPRLGQARFRLSALSVLLRPLGFAAFLTIDDPRHYNELLVACERNGIATLALQHGVFTKYHVGWRAMVGEGDYVLPGTLFVWSEYWRRELLRIGTYIPAERLCVGGPKGEIVVDVPAVRDDGVVGVLIPHEVIAPQEEARRFFSALLACEDVTIYYKLRPDMGREEQLARVGLQGSSDAVITVTGHREIVDRVDVVAGTHSTFLYDMVAYERPVAWMETSLDYGEGMVESGLADRLRNDAGLCANIRRIAGTSAAERKRRKLMLFGNPPRRLSEELSRWGIARGLVKSV